MRTSLWDTRICRSITRRSGRSRTFRSPTSLSCRRKGWHHREHCRLQPANCTGEKQRSKEIAKTLTRLGAPGWDRTSNPCLRRAVLYPLSYGRIGEGSCEREARQKQNRKQKGGCKAHANPRGYLLSMNSSIARALAHRANRVRKPHTIRVNARSTAPAALRRQLSVPSIIDRAFLKASAKRTL